MRGEGQAEGFGALASPPAAGRGVLKEARVIRHTGERTGRPPEHGADAAPSATGVACPFCGSRETELVSPFGSQLSTDQYYCRACRTYFERFSRDDEDA